MIIILFTVLQNFKKILAPSLVSSTRSKKQILHGVLGSLKWPLDDYKNLRLCACI